ncbi:hypothetical protein D3C86_2054750 [compost metagenome]
MTVPGVRGTTQAPEASPFDAETKGDFLGMHGVEGGPGRAATVDGVLELAQGELDEGDGGQQASALCRIAAVTEVGESAFISREGLLVLTEALQHAS